MCQFGHHSVINYSFYPFWINFFVCLSLNMFFNFDFIASFTLIQQVKVCAADK